ncbi:sialate:O-sulfotransferase 1-like [Glandiceps talaboti]
MSPNVTYLNVLFSQKGITSQEIFETGQNGSYPFDENLPSDSGLPFIAFDNSIRRNENCNLSLAPLHTIPMTALASFPGSGNTWTRHLLQQATGIYTGNIHHSKVLPTNAFLGDKEDFRLGTTLTQKTHSRNIEIMELFDSAILLIRNPYHALIAEFNRRNAGKTGVVSESKFAGEEWNHYVMKESNRWFYHAMAWLNFKESLLVVKYSDLTRDTIGEVRKMVEFLGFKLTARRKRCLLHDMEGLFKRKTHRVSSPDPFTEDMHKTIDKHITTVNTMLKKLSYTALENDM